MRKNSIATALRFPAVLSTVIGNIKRQHRFIGKELGSQLADARKSSDGTLEEEDFKKITDYYGLAVPAILGEAICVLRGDKMTLRERMALTYQGAFTGLFDDFFDRHQMTEDMLLSFLQQPERIHPSNSTEKLFLQFFQKALMNFPNKQLTLQYFRKVYDAQVESRKQAVPGLSKEEINRITVDKGGYSVLFYRSVFDHPFAEGEEEAFHQMGGLMQFGNDIFDVYKDSLQGIETPMSAARHVSDVRIDFQEMQKLSFDNFYGLGYPIQNVRKFLRLIYMSLCSRCYVCFDQLEKVETERGRETGGIFQPLQYSRKELVCDMDRWNNKWKSIRYFMGSGL